MEYLSSLLTSQAVGWIASFTVSPSAFATHRTKTLFETNYSVPWLQVRVIGGRQWARHGGRPYSERTPDYCAKSFPSGELTQRLDGILFQGKPNISIEVQSANASTPILRIVTESSSFRSGPSKIPCRLLSLVDSHPPCSEHSTQDQNSSPDFIVPLPSQDKLLRAPRLFTVNTPLLVESIGQSNCTIPRTSEFFRSYRQSSICPS
jgi:hypothetical protein